MRIISGSLRGTRLYTLEGLSTRPTLDRIKESFFNIIQCKIYGSIVLDLFSGSGAIGIEFISRGAEKAILCDNSSKAIKIINKNIEKTNVKDKIILMNKDYIKALQQLQQQRYKFDIIYIDPPYETNFAITAIERIYEFSLLSEDGIIIIETDDEEKIKSDLKDFKFSIYDIRKYGRIRLIFLKRKG